jgi:hypothetical protein
MAKEGEETELDSAVDSEDKSLSTADCISPRMKEQILAFVAFIAIDRLLVGFISLPWPSHRRPRAAEIAAAVDYRRGNYIHLFVRSGRRLGWAFFGLLPPPLPPSVRRPC